MIKINFNGVQNKDEKQNTIYIKIHPIAKVSIDLLKLFLNFYAFFS
jgi:hypothetical protein